MRAFVVLFLTVFLALQIHGVAGFAVAGGVDVKPWNLAVAAVLGLWMLFARVEWIRPKISRGYLLTLVILFAFTCWMGLEVFWSPQPEAASAVFAAHVGNLFLYIAVGSTLATPKDIDRLNRAVLRSGVVIALLALALYGRALTQFREIVSSPDLWDPSVGYTFDRGVVLRLIGFAEDPNFYALYMTLPLLIAVSARRTLRDWIAVAAVGVSLLLAMSRTFFAALLVTSIILGGLHLVSRARDDEVARYYRALGGSLIVVTLGIAALVAVVPELMQFVAARLAVGADQSRLALWTSVVGEWRDPVLGEGLRSIDVLVGDFAHNTYLDVMVETGLVGTVLWMAFLVAVTILGLAKRSTAPWLPWLHGWLLLLGMAATFSLLYNPIFVLMAAVLAGSSGGESGVAAVGEERRGPVMPPR